MTAKQIATELKNKGFKVETSVDLVFVSLNRPVSILEVVVALDHKIEQEYMGKSGNEVVILGQE